MLESGLGRRLTTLEIRDYYHLFTRKPYQLGLITIHPDNIFQFNWFAKNNSSL